MSVQQAIDFEKTLYKLINTSGLPMETAYYILKSVYTDFQKTIYEVAVSEKAAQNKEVTENERNITANFGSNDEN